MYTTRARERGKITAERAREEGREGTERRALTIGIHERSLPGGLACERTLCPVAFHPVHSLSLQLPRFSLHESSPAVSYFSRGATVTGTPYIRPSGNARAGTLIEYPPNQRREKMRRGRKSSRTLKPPMFSRYPSSVSSRPVR